VPGTSSCELIIVLPDSDLSLFASVRQLIAVIARHLSRSAEPCVSDVLRRLTEQPLSEADFVAPEPRRLAVLRHYPDCVGEAMLLDTSLAAQLAAIEEHLNWLQTSAYTDAVLGEGFTANYGWAEVIGPRGFFKGDDFLLGLLMLGPNRHYRDHFHPAPELYVPLTSGSLWRRAPGRFVEKPPGAAIWHEPNQIHATKTGDRPLLALWVWTRDTATPARLIDQAQPGG
jgi:hypothetical protein